MRESPPEPLIALLEQLSLATPRQVAGVYRRARGLARGLPLFESVWVDALAQARVLTAFQAKQINAGCGDDLAVGPYVLQRPLTEIAYARSYRACHRESREPARVTVIDTSTENAPQIGRSMEALAATSARLEVESLAPVHEGGVQGRQVWAAGDHVEGKTAAEWMVHNGRFPPEIVLEIARQMMPGLVALEQAGLCHGDLGPASLLLCPDGRVVMPQPGLRSLVRPEEGYAHANLRPEAYDYVAPERITDGSAPTVASELYACGGLWWHLLTGRPPVPGGTSLAKLRAAQTARIPDVTRLAPEVAGSLSAAVSSCLQKSPSRRPDSIAQLAARLGPSTHVGRMALARCLSRPGRRPRHVWAVSVRTIRHSHQTPLWLAAAAGCLVAAVALGWSIWNARVTLPAASIRGPAESPPGPAPPAEPTAARPAPDNTPPPAQSPTPPAPPPTSEPVPARDQVLESPLLQPAAQPTRPADRLLPVGGPLRVDSLELLPGQTVRGDGTARPLVLVPATGLPVTVDNVRFENIDFVFTGEESGRRPGASTRQIIALGAAGASFHRCSFQSTADAPQRPVALRWTHPVDRRHAEMSLPSGRLELKDCVMAGVDAGIECRTLGARALRLVNTLHLGPGPLIRLDHFPGADEPMVLSLSHVTVRDASAVIECGSASADRRMGRITVEATQGAFVLHRDGSLLALTGPESPVALLSGIQWTGQGSLLGLETPVARWATPDRQGQILDDSLLSMAGLVRSGVEFAGPAENGPAASNITQWQGPLLSTDAPGADPAVLVLPNVEVPRPAQFDIPRP